MNSAGCGLQKAQATAKRMVHCSVDLIGEISVVAPNGLDDRPASHADLGCDLARVESGHGYLLRFGSNPFGSARIRYGYPAQTR
jgi:hypothetical protein